MRWHAAKKIFTTTALILLFLLPGSLLIRGTTPAAKGSVSGPPTIVLQSSNFGTPTGQAAPSSLVVAASIGLFDKSQSPTLQALLGSMYNPSSPLYHNFLTSQQFSDMFAPSSTDYNSAVSYFQSYGLQTYTTSSRLFINLDGTVAQYQSAFGTSLQMFKSGSVNFYENSKPLYLPQSIAQYTTTVVGMGNYTLYVPHLAGSQFNQQAPIPPFAPPYQPGAMEAAYNETGLLNAGTTGAGQTIVLIDAGYGDKTVQVDLTEFSATYGLPNTVVSIQTVNASQTVQDVELDPVNGAQSQIPGLGVLGAWDIETALDVEWAHAMAPGASLVNMISYDPGIGLDQAIAAAIVNHSGNIISQSFGQCECYSNITYSGGPPSQSDAGYVDPFYQMAAATGITVLASSGDSGSVSQPNAPDKTVSWPASDTWVTAVGGTALTISGSGGLSLNQNGGAYGSETAWSCDPGCTGGGYSVNYNRPSWQTGVGLQVTGQYANSRGVPDIAADGDPNTGVVYVVNGVNYGVAFSLGGTSLSSPLWAGVIATLDQFNGANYGFFSPTAYQIFNSPGYTSQFHDVTSGNNGAWNAGKGWDPTTGIGSPNVGCIAYKCQGKTPPPGFGITSPASGAAIGTTSVVVTGTHNLVPGNWLLGQPNKAPAFGTGIQQDQLNILQGYIANYNPTTGMFHGYLTLSNMTNILLPPAGSQGEWWDLQWTYNGTGSGYFVALILEVVGYDLNNTPQFGISYQYGTIAIDPTTGLNTYTRKGTITGSYTPTAPGTIDFAIPTNLVGNPTTGTWFSSFSARTMEIVGTPVRALLETVDQVGSVSYHLGDPRQPNGFVLVATNPVFTGAVNASLVNYPASTQWTATLNLSGLTPGANTIYAEEVESDGIVLQTTSTPFVYTVGLQQQTAITGLTMTNQAGAAQSIFGTGDTAIASVTVKNTGYGTVSGAVITVTFVGARAGTVFVGNAVIPSLGQGQSMSVGLGTAFPKGACSSDVYTVTVTVYNGFPAVMGSNLKSLANPQSTTFVLSCHK